MCKDVYGYVYMVRNKINGKIYFGITVNDFQRRYTGNIAKNTHNDHLRNSINTYGIENFEINEEFDVAYNEDDLWDLEDMYICLYNTLDKHYGYNKRRSGSKRKGCGKMSEESRHKNSETNTKVWANMSEDKKKQWRENCSRAKTEMWANKSDEEKKQHGEATKQGIANMSEEEKRQLSEKRSEAIKGEKHPRATEVICLETQQVFTTIKEAEQWFGCSHHIGNCCRGERNSCGKHPITGERLHWMYYEDYLEQQNKENSDTSNN